MAFTISIPGCQPTIDAFSLSLSEDLAQMAENEDDEAARSWRGQRIVFSGGPRFFERY